MKFEMLNLIHSDRSKFCENEGDKRNSSIEPLEPIRSCSD